MSTTTRTAAATKIYIWNGVKHIFVDAAVCEQIEDELAAVTAERDEAREQWRMSSVCRELAAERDALKHALIELEAAAEAYAADQSRATDSRCGLVQPITVEDGNRLLSALKIANELTK
jgi:sarcosine oxidase delta subunit